MLSAIDFEFRPIIHPHEKSVWMVIVLLPMEPEWFLPNSPNKAYLKKVHFDNMVRQLNQLFTHIHRFFVR